MKEKIYKPVEDDLINLIPQRNIVRTQDFVNLNNIKKMTFFDNSDYNELCDTVVPANEYFFENQNDNSRFCYISHQKKDGILAAKTLFKKLCDIDKHVPVYNPQVDEKSLTSYIKSAQLKSKALEFGYIEKNKIPLWNTVLSVITGILLVFSNLKDFFELTGSIGDGMLSSLFADFNFNIILTLFLIAVFVVSICSIVIQSYKYKKKQIAQLNIILAEMEDEKFVEFINEFNEDDFCIPDCKKEDSVFICVLQNYSFKEKHILKSYWCNASPHQLWWIFSEGTNENEVFVVPASQRYDIRFYYQKPLSKGEKKKIAKVTYAENSKISPMDDSGINKFGVDYLCRFLLKEREPISDIKILNEKIAKFCNEYNSSYQTDIKLMIRIIADLTCTYGFDFTNRRNWQYLFDYNQGDELLNDIDKQVTEALGFNNKNFRNLIPEIINVFSENLEEIVANHPNNEQTREYEQWCIIKALKNRVVYNEDCYFAICDTLMAEFASCINTPEDIGSSQIWKDILIKTAEVFYKNQFFWFLPTLIHNLIYFFGDRKNMDERLFSQSVVLEVARVNLLLSINSESENYAYSRIDLIKDHYKVVCAAATELNKDISLEANSTIPPCFELLQFTNQERRRYYNALHYLKEQSVVDFLNYLFDMFCAVVSVRSNDMKFCYSVIYENTLYEKYMKKAQISSPTDEDYIKIISLRLLDLLDTNFGEKFSRLKDSIDELKLCLSSDDIPKSVVDDILILIIEFDILGFNTLNFISCLIGRVNSARRLSQDIYLNLGNYLLGIVFLSYHEVSKDSFYNEDFKYLVNICTSYEEPGGAVLGFMCFCDTRPKPTASGNQIELYIKSNSDVYIKNLNSLAAQIKYNDIDAFFTFLSCTKKCVSQNQKNVVYETLKKLIENDYASYPNSYLYLEHISLYLTDSSTLDFKNDTPNNNIEKILQLSNNMVYLLYKQYVECYGQEYLKLCHMVADRILKSDFNNKTNTLILYIAQNTSTANSAEFVETVRLAVESLENISLEREVSEIKLYIDFLCLVLNLLNDAPERYSWTTEDKLIEMNKKLLIRLAELIEFQTREFCALRKWSNYGIAIYLRELLKSDVYIPYCPEDYHELSEPEKIGYIIQHFNELQHVVIIDGKKHFNTPYIDMVTAFINNDSDIQHLLDETECMNKLTSGLLEIVKNHLILSDASKVRIRTLLSEYMERMGCTSS